MKSVMLEPIHESSTVRTGTFLLKALLAKECNVLMSCNGNGLCATCHVHVRKGMQQLSPMTDRERRTLTIISGTDSGSRLACQCRVMGDGISVELPKGMYIEKAEDLLSLLGTRAGENILHPIDGSVLIVKGKIITRARIEELAHLREDVRKMQGPEPSASRKTVVFPAPVTPTPPAAPTPPVPPIAVPPASRQFPVPFESVSADAPSSGAIRKPEPGLVPFASEETLSDMRVLEVPDDEMDSVELFCRAASPTTFKTIVGSSGGRNKNLPLEPGTVLGKCVLMEVIGQGGSGTVYRALHKSLNIPVAVKVLRLSNTSEDQQYRERLMAEARLLAQLNHQHVIRVWDVEDHPTTPWLVLELVEGTTLELLIRQSGRIMPDRAVKLVRQVASGLSAAWEIGIVHRDVKPANVLLTRDGKARLADLGLARVVARDRSGNSGAPLNDVAEGTAAYMSPEQADVDSVVDHRSDMYSLGATFYHAVTGSVPFSGRNWMEVLMKHASQPIVPPHQIVPGLPPTIAHIIARMMAKKPQDRYARWEDLLSELAKLENVLSASATTTAVPTAESDSNSQTRSAIRRLFGMGKKPN